MLSLRQDSNLQKIHALARHARECAVALWVNCHSGSGSTRMNNNHTPPRKQMDERDLVIGYAKSITITFEPSLHGGIDIFTVPDWFHDATQIVMRDNTTSLRKLRSKRKRRQRWERIM